MCTYSDITTFIVLYTTEVGVQNICLLMSPNVHCIFIRNICIFVINAIILYLHQLIRIRNGIYYNIMFLLIQFSTLIF